MAETHYSNNPNINNPNSNNNNNNNNNNVNEEDRLGSLPDSLLLEILSRLPFKSAAATSTLSQRWVSLWTHLPHLLISAYDPPFWHSTVDNFCTTVNHILFQLTSPQIHTFHLHFSHPRLENHDFYLCSSSLESWVSLFCARNAVNVEVFFDFSQFGGDYIPLPTSIFQIQSLLQLQLRGFFFCKFPDTGILTLPNLKTLSLNGIDFDTRVLRTLFKSCPVLESLFLGIELIEDEIVEISALKLKSLTVNMRGSSFRTRFLIDAPSLEDITVQDCVAFYDFVKKPSLLRMVYIAFWPFILDQGSVYFTRIPELVRGISSAKTIQLVNNLAIFNYITHLDVNVWSLFRNLTHLRLAVSEEHECWGTIIPPVLLFKLKRIDILGIKGDGYDVSSVMIILRIAFELEKLYVSCFDCSNKDGEQQLWKEYKFCRKLFVLPRSSVNCEIEFSGDYIHTFSDKSQNVLGRSEIDWLGPRSWHYIDEDDEA